MVKQVNKVCITAVLLLIFCALAMEKTPSFAQDWIRSDIPNLQRLDLRNLGYPLINEVPANSSAITSLLTARDGKIYGGTTGDNAYLLVFDPSTNHAKHLGRIEDQESIHHSLVEDRDGFIYLGTGKSILNKIPLSMGNEGGESKNVDVSLWDDIKRAYKDYPGGHLYRYNPRVSSARVKLPEMACEVQDLGIPVANNSIYALAISPGGDEIYGLSYPDGHFFVYSIAVKTFKDLGEIDRRMVFSGPERDWRSLPRALVCDDSGRVFTSGTDGRIVYYDPVSGKIISTEMQVPGDLYPGETGTYAVTEYFARDPERGVIYGGSSDGYFFSFCPKKLELVNLGKLRTARRLRALTVGLDGKVYLVAGERASTKPCQFFRYDPRKGGYENLGVLVVERSPYYHWRGYQFDCMTTGKDGTIFLGESERKSHLFLYIP